MTFSKKQIEDIKKYCEAVYIESRKYSRVDRIQDKSRTGREINLQGIGAEFWFKNKYNIPFSLEITDEAVKPRSYLKDVDVEYDDLVYELKQTSHKSGCLFINSLDWYGKERILLADVYVLVIGSFPDYKKDLFITKKKLKHINKKPRMHRKIGKVGYFAEQSDMYETLEEALAWEKP